MDADAIQLASLEEQYVKVEKETHKLAEELQSSKKKRRQLEAEVRFLQNKVKFFRRNLDDDGPSLPAHGRQQVSKAREEPQFYEVEVQFADSLEAGMIDSSVFDFDYRNEYIPHPYSRQENFLSR